MKSIIILWLITVVTIVLAFILPINNIVARAETKETLTLDSEITRLAKQYTVDEKLVREIIKCESQLYGGAINHNKDKGGKIWSSDWGYLQINDYFHEKTMNKMGFDIHNQWDSLEYGFILISKEGYTPWKASKTCWLPKII